MDLVQRTQDPYTQLYEGLSEVREIFHREGRLNDSNAKLDETVKILAVHYSYFLGQLEEKIYSPLCYKDTFCCASLQDAFKLVAERPPFRNDLGTPVFNNHDRIIFEPGEENIAFELFKTLQIPVATAADNARSFDFLNEAFGHHVRDNFRNHIEDAQYMTPHEVVDFMANMARLHFENNGSLCTRDEFIMMDPSCGVGSFLNAWKHHFNDAVQNCTTRPELRVIGQDKVERMVRLASLNLIFSGDEMPQIYTGNSLEDQSPISSWDGKVDLILTNPPFGARFPTEQVRRNCQRSTPTFALSTLTASSIDSELLFIDRYLSLLRDGGLCLAVVPDGVVSARGMAAYFRQKLTDKAAIRAVIELPPVTFAQAGTRTKTAVLVLEKVASGGNEASDIFFGEAHDLGFDVSKRKGVPIKKSKGINQLPYILRMYAGGETPNEQASQPEVIARWRNLCAANVDAWTPRQFALDREDIAHHLGIGVGSVCSISQVVKSPTKRRPQPWSEEKLYISVLHVIGEGMLDIAGIHEYQPVTPGVPVEPGEVILSRINPRIPRVLVVPDLGREMLCSSEFEVFRPDGIGPYELAFLLLSEPVQKQIRSLTAGTSASHARVKSQSLYEIMLPRPSAAESDRFARKVGEYRECCEAAITSLNRIYEIRNSL